VGVRLGQGRARQLSGAAADRPKQRFLGIAGDAYLNIMRRIGLMETAAFLGSNLADWQPSLLRASTGL
jgi:hypothetical protein